eukprot:1854743-Pleurochrysis_carterae.AAC.2
MAQRSCTHAMTWQASVIQISRCCVKAEFCTTHVAAGTPSDDSSTVRVLAAVWYFISQESVKMPGGQPMFLKLRTEIAIIMYGILHQGKQYCASRRGSTSWPTASIAANTGAHVHLSDRRSHRVLRPDNNCHMLCKQFVENKWIAGGDTARDSRREHVSHQPRGNACVRRCSQHPRCRPCQHQDEDLQYLVQEHGCARTRDAGRSEQGGAARAGSEP